METIRVLLVDDHPVVLEGLRAIFQAEGGVEVVGEASNGLEAVARSLEVRPDVVLMDLRLEGLDGIEATRRIKREHPATKVVVFTMYEDDVYVMEAVRAGASGYVLKDAHRDLLIQTIRAVRSGGVLIKQEALAGLLDSGWGLSRRGPGKMEGLTPREREVVGLIAQGCTNKEIGQALSISQDTAKKHVQSIVAKLGACNRTDAAIKAVRAGVVRPDIAQSLTSS